MPPPTPLEPTSRLLLVLDSDDDVVEEASAGRPEGVEEARFVLVLVPKTDTHMFRLEHGWGCTCHRQQTLAEYFTSHTHTPEYFTTCKHFTTYIQKPENSLHSPPRPKGSLGVHPAFPPTLAKIGHERHEEKEDKEQGDEQEEEEQEEQESACTNSLGSIHLIEYFCCDHCITLQTLGFRYSPDQTRC